MKVNVEMEYFEAVRLLSSLMICDTTYHLTGKFSIFTLSVISEVLKSFDCDRNKFADDICKMNNHIEMIKYTGSIVLEGDRDVV